MGQRVFDMDNEQDIHALFDILSPEIIKICPSTFDNGSSCILINKNDVRVCSKLLAIEWRGKTTVARPIDESDWIGTLCWVWDDSSGKKRVLGVLEKIETDTPFPYHIAICGYKNCCPVKRDEVKFVDDAASDISSSETGADIPNDKYLTITADDITIGGESTTEYNGNKIWNRDECMEYVKDASELFTKEHGAELKELHVVQANNVAGNPIPDTNGKCAWLRCVFNTNGVRRITPWIYYTTYGSGADCGSYCAYGCGYNVRDGASCRGSVFGSVGN